MVKITEARWLVDAVGKEHDGYRHSSDLGDMERFTYVFPSGDGHGWLETMFLAPGMTLSRCVDICIPEVHGQLIPHTELEVNYHETSLVVSSCPNGRRHYREFYPTAELSFGGEQNIVRHTTRTHVFSEVEASSSNEAFAFSVGDSILFRLLGEEMVEVLTKGLGLEGVPSVRVVSIPHHISSVLHGSMQTHLRGALRKLFMQAEALKYLCLLADYVMDNRVIVAHSGRMREVIRQLHAELLNLEGKLPTLDELAGRYGISARTLNDEFKQAYGQSIFSFISDYRLNQAHVALENGSLTLKQLAARLGYSHVNHFNTAFKRKYGYSPGSLRHSKALP